MYVSLSIWIQLHTTTPAFKILVVCAPIVRRTAIHLQPKLTFVCAIYQVSQKKKYGVADYQYFQNGNMQHCNIFRLNKYILCLVVCEVSTPYVKGSWSYERKKGLLYNNKFKHERILSYKSHLTHHSSCVYKFSYIRQLTYGFET